MRRLGLVAGICLAALAVVTGCKQSVPAETPAKAPMAVAAKVPEPKAILVSQEKLRKLSCPFPVFATPDNDIRVDRDPRAKGKPVAIPDAVAALVRKSVAQRLVELETENLADAEGSEWFWNHCGDLFGPAFRLNAPNGLQVYVVYASLSVFGESYYVVPFDPRNHRVASDRLHLSAKWTNGFGFENGLNHAPIMRFERSNDGAQQLVFSEYAHNGNVYNAVIERHFEFAADLSLHQVMATESRVLVLDGSGMIVRNTVSTGPGRYRIEVVKRAKGGAEQALGSYALLRQAPGQPFTSTGFGARSTEDSLTLVTYCMEAKDPDRFQKHGCDFYY